MFPGMQGLDPSKMTPEVIAELTEAMKMLSPDQMMRLQSVMHNSFAGFDVSKELEALEQSFPKGFREKMARVMYRANGIAVPESVTRTETGAQVESGVSAEPKNIDEARLVILRSVSQGIMTPEEALKVLFS